MTGTSGMRRRAGALAGLATIVAMAGAAAPASAQGGDRHDRAEAIEWSRFDAGAPSDADAARLRTVLANAARYAVTTWWTAKGYAAQTDRYLSFGGTGEGNIRPPAGEALALAASLRTGAYDAAAAGVPAAEARARAVRLAASLAHRHAATTTGGWGDAWQSALWAYYAGFAAWLVWEDLQPEDRDAVERMLIHEADRFVDYEVPYYRDETGAVVHPGDSKAEENAWNANLLQLATAMLPRHPHQRLWMHKNLELMVSAFSRPADLDSARRVNGERLSDWLAGSNIADDGTLVNHGFIHPDYMATSVHNLNAVLAYGLAREPAPEAALFNASVVYDALVDHEFASPPFRAPGGTIYVDGSPDLYYPQGNDWGTSRRMHVGLLDVQARALGLDGGAAGWERLHVQKVLDMQGRFSDGRTYGATAEDTYSGREEWVAVHAAQAWLTKWLAHNRAIRITRRAYRLRPADTARARAALQAPRFFAAGVPREVTATVTNDSERTASHVRLRLEVPQGWTATPDTPESASRLRPGATHTARWTVTAPTGAPAGQHTLTARASLRAFDRALEDEAIAEAWLPPAPPRAPAYVSALDWLEAVNGYGAIVKDANYAGGPLTINGTSFAHGLWTNAPSSIGYYVGGACSRFTAMVGIEDYVAAWGADRGSAVFQVFADGAKVFDSGLMRGTANARPVDVSLAGVEELRLVATDGGVDGRSYDHAAWGDAHVDCQ